MITQEGLDIHIENKDQALEKFKVWKALVETQFGFKLKCLRTNNGFNSAIRSLKIFFKDKGS